MVRSLQALLLILLMALLGTSLSGLLSFTVWQGEMITPFRLQLLLASILGLALSFCFKPKLLFVVAMAAVAVNALSVATRLAERKLLPAHSASFAHHLDLVFSNVLCDNRQFSRVTEMVVAQKPDLFVAAETTPEWIAHLDALKTAYPYSYTPSGLGVFGISVYAKAPFEAHLFRIGRHRLPLARLEFTDYVLLVAHPMPPARKRLTEENYLYLDTLAQLAKASRKPVIVAGDLNNTLWSHNLQPLIRGGMQWPEGSGMAYSWPTDRAYMAIQIDHVLTKGAKAGTYRVLPGIGSDHFPVRAELQF